MKCVPEADDPFSFEGPEIYKCKGCPIDWKKGKNVTLKTVKKKQKHKSRGLVRTITKTVQNDSFFNFFTPPAGKICFRVLHFQDLRSFRNYKHRRRILFFF